jgi:tetratricopeptide (TPR) repeat protein
MFRNALYRRLLLGFYLGALSISLLAQSAPCKIQSDFAATVRSYSEIIKGDPTDPTPLIRRGSAYYQWGKQDLALNDLNKAIDLAPALDTAYEMRGRIYAHQAKYREAIADFTKAIELNPALKSAFYQRARSYQFSGMNELAINDYRSLINLDAEYYGAFGGLGMELKKIGQTDEGNRELNAAIVLITMHIERADPAKCNSQLYFDRGVYSYLRLVTMRQSPILAKPSNSLPRFGGLLLSWVTFRGESCF